MAQYDRSYEIVRELGRGGMGIVYLARQRSLSRLVALKVLLHQGEQGLTEVRRLSREARAVKALGHPNVVRLLDYDLGLVEPFLVFEYVDGQGSLNQLLQTSKPSMPQVLTLALELSSGVAHIHERGILHRDLKPSNVLIDAEGHPRIIDLGLSRRLTPDETRLTLDGQVVGTFAYMAPEQLLGREVDARSDVYALGLMMYELVAGRLVFSALADPNVSPARRIAGSIPQVRSVNSRISPRLERLIDRCVAAVPAHRPASGADVFLELTAIVDPDGDSTSSAATALPVALSPATGETAALLSGRGPPMRPDRSVVSPGAPPTNPRREGTWTSRWVGLTLGAAVSVTAVALGWMRATGDRAGVRPVQPTYEAGLSAIRARIPGVLNADEPRLEMRVSTSSLKVALFSADGSDLVAVHTALDPGTSHELRVSPGSGRWKPSPWTTVRTLGFAQTSLRWRTRPGYLSGVTLDAPAGVVGRLGTVVWGERRRLALPWTAPSPGAEIPMWGWDHATLELEDRLGGTASRDVLHMLDAQVESLTKPLERFSWVALESALPFSDGAPVRREEASLLKANVPTMAADEHEDRLLHALRIYLTAAWVAPVRQVRMWNLLMRREQLNLALARHAWPLLGASLELPAELLPGFFPGETLFKHFALGTDGWPTAGEVTAREGPKLPILHTRHEYHHRIRVDFLSHVMGQEPRVDELAVATGFPSEPKRPDLLSFVVPIPAALRGLRGPVLVVLGAALTERGEIFRVGLGELPPVELSVGPWAADTAPGIRGGDRYFVVPPQFARSMPSDLPITVSLATHPLVRQNRPINMWSLHIVFGSGSALGRLANIRQALEKVPPSGR
ncbi:MAG: serine/threonine protein kinase [Candidatus Riflebacteria bacterium]|nr:serine/threonine protein kinase [Candidatus Riflebacteria bacterium]